MRRRSFWGWGYEDRFPDSKRLGALSEQVQLLFGDPKQTPAPPPVLEQLALPPSRVAVPHRLAPIASTSQEERVRHTYGKSYRDLLRGYRGDFASAPDVVLTPRDESDIEAALEWCASANVALIPFGGGTSVVGGVEPKVPTTFNATASLDLRQLSKVLEVDPISRAARIQAGVLGPALDAQLADHGFSLRHYPQSYEFSSLGGWIATRAGGHYATLYTHIDDLVESTRMITPRGIWQSRRLPASGAGPSPDRLVLGSEGALGVITEAWMRVQPRPKFRASASVHFDQFERAVAAARTIAQAGLHPSNCRLLDAQEAFINQVAMDGSTVLLLAFESADHPLEPWLHRAVEIATAEGGTLPEPARFSAATGSADASAHSWRAAFLDAPYLQTALVTLDVLADTFETACTWDHFPALHARVVHDVEETLRRVCGAGVVTCRFTHVYPDGPAPYYTFLAPARRGAELEQWAEVKRAASEALLACGATITHHHAVGRTHRPWYDRERPEPFALALRAAKQAVDPAGVLNPGVLVDA